MKHLHLLLNRLLSVRNVLTVLVMLAAFTASLSVYAGEQPSDSTAAVKKKRGTWLKRFIRNFDDYDTTYIKPNYYNWTAMLQNTNFYQTYRMTGRSEAGEEQTLTMSPSSAFKVGPYFGWRWLFLGYTFDVGNPQKATRTTEFSLSLYSSMLGCDLVYVRNTGDFSLKRASGFPTAVEQAVRGREFSGMDSYTASANLYYVFNHRKFSYPAAYAQSTVQRRSAGSWLMGLSYSRQRINFDYRQLPGELVQTPILDELKIDKIDYRSFNVNAGYAYNWVFARNWLLSASLTPAVGIRWTEGERITGENIWDDVRHFNFDFVSRAGLVWNNSHYFAGASAVSHIFGYRKAGYTLNNSILYFNVYVGFMLGRKSQYRNR